MVKVKNKRNARAADRVQQKRKTEANKKKLNPFEVHINREKHTVLGKKSKHDRGLPGVSRAKAIQKRKKTLGTEMKLMHKTNTFIDKRIGEKNSELSAEDKMVARFAAERAKQHNRKDLYNLADEEVLTHRGQTLEQIEKFDDPRSDEEDETSFKGLDNDFVSEGHFGGGVLSKSENDGAKSHKDLIEQLIAESKKRKAEKQKEKEQTLDLTEKLDSEWKDLQPVVFKRAREEESAIDKVLNKAEQVGQDYDKMMRELRFEKRGTPSDAIKSDEKLEREEKLRIAQLEKERDMRMRAEHEVTTQPARTHRSADDLDDNFELEDEKEFMLAYDKDGKPLVPENILKDYSVPNPERQYDDGLTESEDDDEQGDDDEDCDEASGDEESEVEETKSDKEDNVEEKSQGDKEKSILFQNSDDCDENDDAQDEEEESDDDEKESSSNKSSKEQNVSEKVKKLKHEVAKQEEDDSSDDSEASEHEEQTTTSKASKTNTKIQLKENDVDSKLKQTGKKLGFNGKSDESSEGNNSSEEEDGEEETKELSEVSKNQQISPSAKIQNSESDEDSSDKSEPDEVLNDVQKKKIKISKPKKLIGDSESEDEKPNKLQGQKSEDDDDDQLKSYLGKTADYENFKELLAGKNPSQQSSAIQKLIKTYDPSLAENNKEKLSKLFANMLQYVNDLFTNLTNEGEIMKSFLIFNNIVQYFYDIAHANKVSSRKFFAELLKTKYETFKKKPKRIPNMDTLIFFKLISLLYPTSDFRHPLTTPSLTFMSQILHSCKFRDAYSISRGIFVTTLILEYTLLSKRFVPSAVNFIRGVLYLSAKTTVLNPIQVVPPFRLHRDAKILNLEDDCSKLSGDWKMTLNDLLTDTIDNGFKIRILYNAIVILREFFDNCSEMEAQECIFEPHIQLMSRLELELYPKKVASFIEDTIKYMKGTLEVKTYTPLTAVKAKPKVLRLYEPDIQEVFTGSKSSKLSRETAERQRLEHKVKREMKGALREIRRDKAYIASVKIKGKIQSDNMRKQKVKQIYKEASIQQGELNKLKRGK